MNWRKCTFNYWDYVHYMLVTYQVTRNELKKYAETAALAENVDLYFAPLKISI